MQADETLRAADMVWHLASKQKVRVDAAHSARPAQLRSNEHTQSSQVALPVLLLPACKEPGTSAGAFGGAVRVSAPGAVAGVPRGCAVVAADCAAAVGVMHASAVPPHTVLFWSKHAARVVQSPSDVHGPVHHCPKAGVSTSTSTSSAGAGRHSVTMATQRP